MNRSRFAIGILRSMRATAFAVVAASTASLSWAVGPLAVPQDITDECAKVDENAPRSQRLEALWPAFDKNMWGGVGSPPLIQKDIGKWAGVAGSWNTLAIASEADRTEAESAWRAAVHQEMARSAITRLAAAQLELFRCFLGSKETESRLNEEEVRDAFKALALGTYAGEGNSGRMDELGNWLFWGAFADSYLQYWPLPTGSEEAWKVLQRGILYGVLLHAHHDPRKCSDGTFCKRNTRLKPANLSRTDQTAIRTFAFAPRTDPVATIRSLYRIGHETGSIQINKAPPSAR